MSIASILFPEIEGPEFIEGPGLARVAEEVLARHGVVGGIGRLFNTRRAIRDEQIRVLYLINTKPFNPLQDDITHDAIAKTVKAPRLWHDVTGYDAVIWARSYFWGQFDEDQQAAVALHELLHLEVEFDDEGQAKLRLRKHDVEDFNEVIRYYGAFLPSRAEFFKAFGLWQEDRGQPPVEGEQTVVPFERRPKTAQEAAASRVVSKRAARLADRGIAAEPPDDITCDGSVHVPGCAHFDEPDDPAGA